MQSTLTPGRRAGLARAVWGVIAVAHVACGQGDGIGRFAIEGDDMMVGAPIHQILVEHGPEHPDVFGPSKLRVWGDSVIVSDNMGDQVVILDTALAVGRTIGRRGRGPGELRDPLGIEVGDDWIAVAEVTNGRISVFEDDGSLRRHIVASSTIVAVDGTGRVYSLGFDPDYYLTVTDVSGAQRPFGRVPVADEASFSGPGAVTGVLVAAASGAVHVFDNGRGILFRFGDDGSMQRARRLPRSVDRWMRERIDAQRADFGGAPVSTGMAKDLAPTLDGNLFLTFVHPEFLGLIIDADTYSARAVRLPETERDREWLRGATGVIIAADRLYAAARGGLAVYELKPDRP